MANGNISRAYVDAKNPMSAYNKAKRMFPDCRPDSSGEVRENQGLLTIKEQ